MYISGYDNGTIDKWNGYLSEFYFAEVALDAAAFAESNSDGEWIPLSSDVVEENISNGGAQPYDHRTNTSEVWSGGTTSGTAPFGASNWSSVFNGAIPYTFDQNNLVYMTGDGTFTFPTPLTGRIQVYAALGSVDNRDDNRIILSDGSELPITNGNASFELYDFGNKTGITSIRLKGGGNSSGIGVPGIRLDGHLLVDTGLWNQTQNWTGDATITGQTTADAGNYGPWKYGFDGNEYTFVETSSTTKLVFSTPVPFSSLQVKATGTYKINDTSVTATGVGSGSAIFEHPAGITAPISSIELLSSGSLLLGVKVDGAILVDAGASWNTSQMWSDYLISDNGKYANANPPTKAYNGEGGSTS